jgi:hypothetical protein
VKSKTRSATSGSAKRPTPTRASAKRTKPAAMKRAKPAATKRTKPAAVKRAKPAATKPALASRASASRWVKLVEEHGVVLASARGAVPCVAEAVAGEPIVGSWWAHPKGKAIFSALSELDDSEDVRCFKLIGGKVTFVHRRMWAALACLATGGVLAAGRVASIQQEHMPTGEHRNLVTPFPDWVPDDVTRAAAAISIDDARALFATWL